MQVVVKDRQVPVPTPVEKIVEKIVYKDRQVPQVSKMKSNLLIKDTCLRCF